MARQRDKNPVNEGLPNEHEVIQHSLRETSDKGQLDIAQVKNNKGVRKADDAPLDDAAASSAGKSRKE